MYTCTGGACTLLSLAALTNIQQRRSTKPQIYEWRSKGSALRGRGAGRSLIKARAAHGEPLSAADLLSSDKTHTALIFQPSLWPSHRFLKVCCDSFRLWQMPCIEITQKKSTGWRTLQECNNNETGTIFCKRNEKKFLKLQRTKILNIYIYSIIRPTLQNYKDTP